MSAAPEVLRIESLRVQAGDIAIVEEMSLQVRRGEVVGLVGESGSGKTTSGLALLGFATEGARIVKGTVEIAGERLTNRPENELRRLRGELVAYVPQDPSTSLNPSMRVGDHVAEMLRAHGRQVDEAHIARALERVSLPADREFRRRFPHQLSGGQQQRLTIAIAVVCEPKVAILDEPTTGLDVVTQARILDEVRRLARDVGVAMVYVSHDLSVVGSLSDRIAVMYAGRIVEEGPTQELLAHPRHPYTVGLLSSLPDHAAPRRLRGISGVAVGIDERPAGCRFAPRCRLRIGACDGDVPALEAVTDNHAVRCLRWREAPTVTFEARLPRSRVGAAAVLTVHELEALHRSSSGTVVAAREVSFAIGRGECVALVGESGSGKTTIARCVVGLHQPSQGRVVLDAETLAPEARQRTKEQRRRLQIVFQNPYDSLNPRRTVAEEVGMVARFFHGLNPTSVGADVAALLERVRLPTRVARRYPADLSGGERQRVAIARALAARPDVMVCDEVTSALDVSVQAAVLDLLGELQRDMGLALLFITHDLGVVASIADSVVVLEHGVVREQADVATVLSEPADDYTRRLIEAAPVLPLA